MSENKKQSKQALEAEAAQKREQIIHDAVAMKRLLANPDFIRYFELLKEDRDDLNAMLLNEYNSDDRVRTRLIARINQIDRSIKKPEQMIWRSKNLTEVRGVIQENIKQSRERQALGNKTGGGSDE